MQHVLFSDLGTTDYKTAWDYQEQLLQQNVKAKSSVFSLQSGACLPDRQVSSQTVNMDNVSENNNDLPAGQAGSQLSTANYLLFVEHPPVYTLGKSGKMENVLIDEAARNARNIQFFHTNRGGDITFHGPGQLVGYPILDLEKFYTDIGRYLRNLEEVIILTMAAYGLKGERSAGETGVWLDPGVKGKERKICAIGVRCSRWITMHGFAFNINTDLSYFDHIIPCGIVNKQVTSLQKELNWGIDEEEVKQLVKKNFEQVFEVQLV